MKAMVGEEEDQGLVENAFIQRYSPLSSRKQIQIRNVKPIDLMSTRAEGPRDQTQGRSAWWQTGP